jgi:hypothetical protein
MAETFHTHSDRGPEAFPRLSCRAHAPVRTVA